MDKVSVRRLINAFKAGSSSVTITTKDDPVDVVREALLTDPVSSFFVDVTDCTDKGRDTYTLTVRYKDTDIPRSDVTAVGTMDDCMKAICRAAAGYRERAVLVSRTELDGYKIIDRFYKDHLVAYPHLEKFRCTYSYRSSLSLFYLTVTPIYRIGKVKLRMMEIELEEEVKRIARIYFLPGSPEEARIYLAHNYLTQNVEYIKNRDNPLQFSYTQSAYGALIKKSCVCQGFAEAFKRLMDAAGIPCMIVSGMVLPSPRDPEGGPHAWNIVTCRDTSFHIDTTWDENLGHHSYRYLCMSDKAMSLERTWEQKGCRKCQGAVPVLAAAKKYVLAHKSELLSRGAQPEVLDVK